MTESLIVKFMRSFHSLPFIKLLEHEVIPKRHYWKAKVSASLILHD